jgi:protein ImuB
LLQTVDFDDPVDSSEALLFVFNRLLHVLASRLAARHVAAGTLHIHLQLERGELRRDIHLPEPLSAPAMLLQPVQTFVESLQLPAPVTGITLDAGTAQPLARQNDWTGRQLPHPERWADTLARLQALLGTDRVGIPTPLDVHRSDAFVLRDAATAAKATLSNRPAACSVPLRRFRPPLKIAVAFEPASKRPLALLSGPHCGEVLDQRGPFLTSGHQWDPALSWKRLEWDIQLQDACLLRLAWLPGNQWQLEGIYG